MSKKIFKKKDLTELVDDKGGKLQGDKHVDQSNRATTINDVGDDQSTTDDIVLQQRQGVPSYRRFYSEEEEVDSLEEVAKNKMKDVLEDILSKKNYGKEIIDNVKYSNGIPEMDTIKESLPVLVRKVSHIKTLIDRDEVSGEEKAILINSLLSINLTDIPQQYKRELTRKLGY